ncbi:hypothetical protein [Nocardia goodfellowii]|uniref:DUF5642 domain-containing protein n=1 Tax=Nocardia goodfellowii TaxID=882446 RepID=A0ABS4QDJ2_9NOCA|nr:hypothetical protein [Nocardia goodfellowii]MBP2189628.1 hypothetical protein [Nocardia goodfellowii]
MRLIWLTVPALLAATVAGCADDDKAQEAAPVTTTTVAAVTTTVAPVVIEGVRVPLGDTEMVVVPADAVMDIKVPAAWGDAVAGLRCTVTDSTGRNEDLRSGDQRKRETVDGRDWTTLWTFSSSPATEVTVGCKDPQAKVDTGDVDYLRVTPRGLLPE